MKILFQIVRDSPKSSGLTVAKELELLLFHTFFVHLFLLEFDNIAGFFYMASHQTHSIRKRKIYNVIFFQCEFIQLCM